MKIIISILQKASDVLAHFSTVLGQNDNDWFTNRTGCSSRDWKVQSFGTCGHWRSARQAMKAARIMARDLALYRYRFSDGALNAV